jgi:small-conductance mechanosensitive channel
VASGTLNARNRPWRAIITLVLAIGAAVSVHIAGTPLRVSSGTPAARNSLVSVPAGHLITVTGTVVFFIVALISTFAFASWGQDMLGRFIGAAYGAIVRYVVILVGIAVVLLAALSLLGFRVGQLIVGGAVTGVLLTIAAQQSLSNVFAGVMLQFAQPFRVGDRVRIRAGALGGTIEGTVTEFSITYVRMETDDGRVMLPNSQVLAAAVGPAPHPATAGAAKEPGGFAPPQAPQDPDNPGSGTSLG